jgi:thioredoxin 1
MNPSVKAMLVIAFAVALSACVAVYNRQSAGKELVPWRTDVAPALDDARAGNKYTLLYFTADWCGPCQAMKANTWSDPTVAKALEGYETVKIDVDRQGDVAMKYQVNSIPRMIVLDAAGQVTRDETGGMSAGEFVAWLKR